MATEPITITAYDLINEDEDVLVSAKLIASRVIEHLKASRSVILDMEGVKGASSSFFNVLFIQVRDAAGPAALSDGSFVVQSRVRPQQVVLERSLQAVRQSAA